MKKFMVALLAVLMVSSVAYGASIEWDGSYYVRGSYFKNDSQIVDADEDTAGTQDPEAYTNYDHELSMDGQINVADTTFIRFRFEIADETFGAPDGGIDENLELQRVWGGHTFGTGTKLEFGQMTGGAWASSFADNAGEKYRIKVGQPIPVGVVGGVLEKNTENGSDVEDSEKNDNDAYYAYGIFKAGALNIKPLLGYVQIGSADLADDSYNTITFIDLGLDGMFGIVGFETELVYQSKVYDETATDDHSMYGLFLDVYAQLDAVKPGIFFAYGSVDKDTGDEFAFGDDFAAHGSLMLGDEFQFGNTADQVSGATLFGAYVNFAASDALSFGAQVGYAKGNSDASHEDDTCLDAKLTGAYKITDAVTYDVGFGYASIDRDQGDDPDPGYKLFHRMKIAF